MDLVTKLPKTPRQNDSIWESSSSEVLNDIYIREVVSRDREDLGTQMQISTTFHPQTDGQSERLIQTLEDMRRASVIHFSGSWDAHLPLAKFVYNNSYHYSIKMSPYEMLYGRKCRTLICWARVGRVAYRLKLPEELSGIHDTFHLSQLRKCLIDEASYVSLQEMKVNDKLSYVEEPVRIIDQQIKKLRDKTISLLNVQWRHRKGSKFTWETEEWMIVYCPSVYQEWFVKALTE
ncbi:uncharacterized protein [Rutidosis leptorrhynchoides]|uniref:uncharacterized protein n=1 Tax=Rutidosis leptorrhynchoides TaxID=125765 RepID=UPI003A9A5F33